MSYVERRGERRGVLSESITHECIDIFGADFMKYNDRDNMGEFKYVSPVLFDFPSRLSKYTLNDFNDV